VLLQAVAHEFRLDVVAILVHISYLRDLRFLGANVRYLSPNGD
jgi:hypothetical protein